MRWIVSILVLVLGTQAFAQSSSRQGFSEFEAPGERFAFVDLAPSQRGAVNFICSFPWNPANGWVAEKIALALDTRGRGVVSDGIVARYHGAPRRVTVRQRSGNVLSVRWSVRNVNDRFSQRALYMDYEMQLNQNTGIARVFAHADTFGSSIFESSFRNTGKCERRR